jgi:Family of unknown function (DUF5990)
MAQSETSRLNLRLICADFPSAENNGVPTEFGMQDKTQQLLSGVPVAAGMLSFTTQLQVRLPATGTEFDVAGLYVHGAKGGRFLYFGYRPQGATAWIRRWKFPLYEIPNNQIVAALNQTDRVLAATISMAGKLVWVRPIGDQWNLERI